MAMIEHGLPLQYRDALKAALGNYLVERMASGRSHPEAFAATVERLSILFPLMTPFEINLAVMQASREAKLLLRLEET